MLQSVRECHRVLQSVTEWHRVSQSGTECHRLSQSVTECYRMLQIVTACHRVSKSVTECHRVSQSVTEYYRVFLAHLIGPILGLVLKVLKYLKSEWSTRAIVLCRDPKNYKKCKWCFEMIHIWNPRLQLTDYSGLQLFLKSSISVVLIFLKHPLF